MEGTQIQFIYASYIYLLSTYYVLSILLVAKETKISTVKSLSS